MTISISGSSSAGSDEDCAKCVFVVDVSGWLLSSSTTTAVVAASVVSLVLPHDVNDEAFGVVVEFTVAVVCILLFIIVVVCDSGT